MIFEFDQKYCPIRPDISAGVMRRGFTLESGPIAYTLDDPGDVGCDAQLVHLLGHGDIVIGERCVINDHIFAGVRSRLFE